METSSNLSADAAAMNLLFETFSPAEETMHVYSTEPFTEASSPSGEEIDSKSPRRGSKRPLEENKSVADDNQPAPKQAAMDGCVVESRPENTQTKPAQTKRGRNGKSETGVKRSQPLAQRRYRERVKQRVADLESTVVKLTEQLAATKKKISEEPTTLNDEDQPTETVSKAQDLNQIADIALPSGWLMDAKGDSNFYWDSETPLSDQSINASFGEAVTDLQILLSSGADDSRIAVQLAVVVDAYLSSMDPLSNLPENLLLDDILHDSSVGRRRDKNAAFEKVLALVGLRREQLHAIIVWRDAFVAKLSNLYSARQLILRSLHQTGAQQVLQANLEEQKNLTTQAFVQFFYSTLGSVRDSARLISCFAPRHPDLLGLSNFIYQNSECGQRSSC